MMAFNSGFSSVSPYSGAKRRQQSGNPGASTQGGRPAFAPPPQFNINAPSSGRFGGGISGMVSGMPSPIPPARSEWASQNIEAFRKYHREPVGIHEQRQQNVLFAGDREVARLREQQAQEGEALRRQYTQNLALGVGQQLERTNRAAEQNIGRRGLTGSGLEQAAFGAAQAAAAGQTARSLGEFESQLLQSQQNEVESVRAIRNQVYFGLMQSLNDEDMQKRMLKFQQSMQPNVWQAAAGQLTGNILGNIAPITLPGNTASAGEGVTGG